MGWNVPNFYFQSSLMSSGRLISELGWNLLDDNEAGPKRVKGIEIFQNLINNDVQYLKGA